REDPARRPRERATAPCLADGGTTRHRQGDARLALRALPVVRPAAGRAVWRRCRGRARRGGRGGGRLAGRCGVAPPHPGRMRAEIAVDDVRELGAFMHMTPAMGQWRVAIVDSADEMNRNSANAVLKILEEPPPNAVLLIVAHAPGRLLPTIRSRCRRLALQPLADDIVMRLLGDYAPDVKEQERLALARLAEGSIGRALELAGAGSLELYSEMVGVLATLPELDMARLHGFAERFARRGEEANAAWRSLNYLFDGWLKGLARQSALGGEAAPVVPAERGLQARLLTAASLDRWITAWEKAAELLSGADRVNLDRNKTVPGTFPVPQSAITAEL